MSNEQYDASTEFLDYLDEVFHKLTNNQQVALGYAELVMSDVTLNKDSIDGVKMILRMISENNSLVHNLRSTVKEMRGGR